MEPNDEWFDKSKLTGRFRRLSSDEKLFVFELRDHPTQAEIALWELLRKKRVGGFRFRFQHKIGPYIADFYCPAASLVIEVDGPIHRNRREYDTNRTAWLQSIGLKVIRFSNEEVLTQPDQVKAILLKELLGQVSSETPK
jgi:5-methyltetrahydrofolate--homocysteine methyltransferase